MIISREQVARARVAINDEQLRASHMYVIREVAPIALPKPFTALSSSTSELPDSKKLRDSNGQVASVNSLGLVLQITNDGGYEWTYTTGTIG